MTLLERLQEDFPQLWGDGCYDFSVGDGWEVPLRHLSAHLAYLGVQLPEGERHPCIVQCKEKFGSGRCYLSHYPTEEWQKATYEYEEVTSRTCEFCGAPGKLVNTRWLKTLCELCEKDWRRARK